MRSITNLLLTALALLACAPAAAVARPQKDETPAALYKAVEDYPAERRAEMRAQGKMPGREDYEKIEREQRELAARNAARIAARTDLSGMDYYYLGGLYTRADKSKEALEALRRFLSDKTVSSGSYAQSARNLVAIYAARAKMLEEAEAARTEYMANTPRMPYLIYQIEYELGAAYLKAKQYDRAAERAAEALRIVKTLDQKSIPREARREQLIFSAAETLAEAYSSAKKKDEALAAVVELYQLALDLPSANLYRMAVSRFPDKADDAERAIVARASDRRGTPPELTVAEWLDQEPLKLADLRGQVVLIDFWYEWCGPCLRAFPTIRDWSKKYKERGFVVIGLTDLQRTLSDSGKSRDEKMEFLRKFKQGNKLNYAIAVAEKANDNLPLYGVSAFPTAVLIDRRGAVRFISIGVSPEEMSRLGEMVDKLVKETPQ